MKYGKITRNARCKKRTCVMKRVASRVSSSMNVTLSEGTTPVVSSDGLEQYLLRKVWRRRSFTSKRYLRDRERKETTTFEVTRSRKQSRVSFLLDSKTARLDCHSLFI